MNFRTNKSRRARTEINMTALIDVVFILLIFFLITSTFVQNNGFEVDLPQASASATPSNNHNIIIAITKQGDFVYDGTTLTAPDLAIRLTKDHKTNQDAVVLLQADTAAEHGKVVQAMDLARQAGFKRLGIATLDKN